MSARTATHSLAAIARLLMISERRVQQLCQEGVIPRAERGRYDLEAAVQGYISFLQARTHRADDGEIDYHVEKARLTRAQADMAELQVARERGDVVSVAQIERNLAGVFAEVRANVRNVPGRVVSSLVGQTDERAIRQVLLAEIDQVLQALANTDVLVLPSGDEEDVAEVAGVADGGV